MLWKCLYTIQSWFELFLQINPSLYIGLPMTVYSTVAHCTAMLFRLSTFEHPGWDLTLVRETYSLCRVLDRVCHNFTLVKSLMGLDPGMQEDISMFAAAYKRTSAIKHWCDVRFGPEATSRAQDETPTSDGGGMNDLLVEFADDAWLREVFNGEEFRSDQV